MESLVISNDNKQLRVDINSVEELHVYTFALGVGVFLFLCAFYF